MNEKCDFGCYTDNLNEKCTDCGCIKGSHLTIHPHLCQGKFGKNEQTPEKSCPCKGFKSQGKPK
jgi:hypothetical protein